jgi:hypothetical protein
MNEKMNEGKERTKRREKYEKTGITEGGKRTWKVRRDERETEKKT